MQALKWAQPAERPQRVELDELTLLRAKRGDRAAFGALVRFYQRPVFALLSRMRVATDRRDLVEDLAQETFVRALRAIGTFGDDGRNRLSSWLLTIATRVALDALKRRALPTQPLGELSDIVPGTRRADDELERRSLREAIGEAVERLPVGYRAAFLLREVHGFEYEAIAEALDIDVGTVKSRLSRARAALRAALSEIA
jgi:RNA polymerase sigma-70 factor (ECF subfamily)